MILIALGANIVGPWGEPKETIARALRELNLEPLRLIKASSLLVTKPFGVMDQPDFVNAVASIATALQPEALMQHLHKIEAAAGRIRSQKWGPRTLDLDLIDYNGLRCAPDSRSEVQLELPHPGIGGRDFVLRPIAEIAPNWKHPVSGKSAVALLEQLKP